MRQVQFWKLQAWFLVMPMLLVLLLAIVGKLDRQRHAFGGDDLAALAPGAFEEIGGAVVRKSHWRKPRPAREK